MTMILGIDPGLDGALAVLTEAGELVAIHDMPTLLDGAKGGAPSTRRSSPASSIRRKRAAPIAN